MHPFPHHYVVRASSQGEQDIMLASTGLPSLPSAAPVEFDGPGGRWSPETLIVAAVGDCFVLTFRTMARMSKLEWQALECAVEGLVDRVERVIQFTEFRLRVTLTLPAAALPADEQRAERLLHKAHDGCLVSNSLKGATHLVVDFARGL